MLRFVGMCMISIRGERREGREERGRGRGRGVERHVCGEEWGGREGEIFQEMLYSGPLGGVNWARGSGSLCEKWSWAYI